MTMIEQEQIGPVAIITIAREEVRNALSSAVIGELSEVVKNFSTDPSVWAVVFTGKGDKAFSAGADLKERQGMTEREALTFVENIQSTFQAIAELPMPTIAAINGDAFGGGLELALACDVRVQNTNAFVGLTECSLGIIPGAGGTQRLPRIVGIARAMDLIFQARRLSAQEAYAIGLSNYLVDGAENTRIRARELAASIAKNAPLAVRAAKAALLTSLETPIREGLVAEHAAYVKILATDDRLEGLRAFREKRPPRFTAQ